MAIVFANRQAEGRSPSDVQLSTRCQTTVKKSSGTAPCYCVCEAEKPLRQTGAERSHYVGSVDRPSLAFGVCSISVVVSRLIRVKGDWQTADFLCFLHCFTGFTPQRHHFRLLRICFSSGFSQERTLNK